MSIETSKRTLAKATASELEGYKKWLSKWCLQIVMYYITSTPLTVKPSLEMDPNAAGIGPWTRKAAAQSR